MDDHGAFYATAAEVIPVFLIVAAFQAHDRAFRIPGVKAISAFAIVLALIGETAALVALYIGGDGAGGVIPFVVGGSLACLLTLVFVLAFPEAA